jgi:hypothetical protein
MDFANIILDISRDARPAEPGFQPSGLYITVCLVIPIVMGVIAGLVSSLVMRLFKWKRQKQEIAGDL